MNREQEISQSQPFSYTKITSIEEVSEVSHQASALSYKYKYPGDFDQKLKKIISQLYRWLDSISGEKSYRFSAQNPASSYQKFITILEFLRSEKIINAVSFGVRHYHDAPPFSRCDISYSSPDMSTDGQALTIHDAAIGHGFGKDADIVFSKAIGEFLERYFLLVYHRKNLVRSSYASLQKRGLSALNPDTLAGFSIEQKRQYPKRTFTDDSVFSWGKATRVLTRAEVWVPAQCIYWNYDLFHDEQEPMLGEFNTNGAGGMFTEEGAILSGLYELIQRDAFLLYWLNGLTPVRIIPESIPGDEFQNLLKESKRYGFKVHCMNVTTDITVPSFMVVIIDETGKGPYFSLGGGCQADPAKALHRALEEAWSVYYWMRPRSPFTLPEHYKPFSDSSIGQDERLRLSANREMAKHYQFFINGELREFQEIKFDYPARFSSEKEELTFLVKKVENLGSGYEVFSFCVQHPLLEKLGYYSVRVIVPALIPLYLMETNAPLGAERLTQVPVKFGFKARQEFYPVPHPFP